MEISGLEHFTIEQLEFIIKQCQDQIVIKQTEKSLTGKEPELLVVNPVEFYHKGNTPEYDQMVANLDKLVEPKVFKDTSEKKGKRSAYSQRKKDWK